MFLLQAGDERFEKIAFLALDVCENSFCCNLFWCVDVSLKLHGMRIYACFWLSRSWHFKVAAVLK